MSTAQRPTLAGLLAECTALVTVADKPCGTAFFIADDLAMTCAHVVPPTDRAAKIALQSQREKFPVLRYWREPDVPRPSGAYPFPDLAVLEVAPTGRPWVTIEDRTPLMFLEADALYAVGWNETFARGKPRLAPLTLQYEGELLEDDYGEDWYLQVRQGRIVSGMSGAALLNRRTGRVCAMINRTQDERSAMGGWAVPFAQHLDRFPEIRDRLGKATDRWTNQRHDDLFHRLHPFARPAYRPLPHHTELPHATLLRPEFGVVPFRGRDDDLDDLTTWCASDPHAAVRLIVGPAGIGKTRLASELCKRMTGRSWVAGFVSPTHGAGSLDRLREIGDPVLIIVDYGDARPDMDDFLVRLQAPPEAAPRTRVIVLARSNVTWLRQQLTAQTDAAIEVRRIHRLLTSVEATRTAYAAAYQAFVSNLGRGEEPAPEPPYGLPGQQVLVVHMAALQAADSDGPALQWMVGSAQSLQRSIVDSFLAREENYWQRSAQAAGVHADPVLLRRCVTLIGLFGLADETTVSGWLLGIPDLADSPAERRHGIARWLRAFFSHYAEGDSAVVQPDLLLERLIAVTLIECPTMFETLVTDERPGVLAAIARACESDSQLVQALEGEFCRHITKAALLLGRSSSAPLRELFIRIATTVDLSATALLALINSISTSHPPLVETAIALGQRAVELATEDEEEMLVVALLNQLASRQRLAHKRDDAVATSRRALDLVRRAREFGAVDYSEDIQQLMKLIQYLVDADRREEAVQELNRALDFVREDGDEPEESVLPLIAALYAKLKQQHSWLGHGVETRAAVIGEWETYRRVRFVTDTELRTQLAWSFHNRLSVLRKYIDEDILWAETIAIHGDLMADLADDTPSQATTWFWLAQSAKLLSRHDEAWEAIDAAEAIVRIVAASGRAAHAVLFSRILTEKASWIRGDPRQALALAYEVVDHWSEVVKSVPGGENFSNLASAYARLAKCLQAAGLKEKSVRAAVALVELRKSLADGTKGKPDPLGQSAALSTAVQIMLDAGKPHMALTFQIERLTIDRRLAARDFRTHGWNLANSLLHAGHVQRAGKHPDQVRAMAREAVNVARRMQRQSPDADGVRLSKVLVTTAVLLASVESYDDILPLLAEAVRIRRDNVGTEDPGANAMMLARALGYHADALAATGDWAAALDRLDEAFVLCARALAEFPMDRGRGGNKTDTQEFYTFLVRLHGTLEHLGMPDRAETIRARGMEILALLVERYQNAAAARLLSKPLPKYRPQALIHDPGHHWLVR